MRLCLVASAMANTALATSVFLNEPDTGLQEALSNASYAGSTSCGCYSPPACGGSSPPMTSPNDGAGLQQSATNASIAAPEKPRKKCGPGAKAGRQGSASSASSDAGSDEGSDEGSDAGSGAAPAPAPAPAPSSCGAARRQLPSLDMVVGLPDFDAIAREVLPLKNYTYYRNGAAGEWSYRNNLEVYRRYRLRPRVLRDISKVNETLRTTILDHEFSAPFFISPCARADYGHPDAELNLMKAAGEEGILYMPALFASLSMENITAVKKPDQIHFQQLYLNDDDEKDQALLDQAQATNASAIVFTVDSAADGNRHRAARFNVTSADSGFSTFTWEYFLKLREKTEKMKLPIILKGIMTVDDASLAVQHGAAGIILSNHGGRQLDGAPSALEVALEIFNKDRDIFDKITVLADGGVRYGVDAIMLLSLGVKAVGIGRPFMYANAWGQEGVKKAITIMKRELAIDAGNLGVADLQKLREENVVDWTPNNWNV